MAWVRTSVPPSEEIHLQPFRLYQISQKLAPYERDGMLYIAVQV